VKPTFILKGPAAGGTVTLTNNLAVAGGDSRLTVDSSVGAATLNVSGFNFTRGNGSGVLDVTGLSATGSVTIGSTGASERHVPVRHRQQRGRLCDDVWNVADRLHGLQHLRQRQPSKNAATNSLINQGAATSIGLATGTTH
jgi:hypothetical protein